MSARHHEILLRLDDLYERVVTSPRSWTNEQLGEWMADLFSVGEAPSRATAREVRRALRMAQRLRDFWLDPPANGPSDAGDWRSRVDIAFGVRAWRPLLEMARVGLAENPTEELFDEARARFREVHGSPWMEGVSYEEWLSGSR